MSQVKNQSISNNIILIKSTIQTTDNDQIQIIEKFVPLYEYNSNSRLDRRRSLNQPMTPI
jgi:hypothetical protein